MESYTRNSSMINGGNMSPRNPSRPIPKRGQVKMGIVVGLAHSVASKAAKQESRTDDALMVRGRIPRRSNSKFRGNSRSNSRSKSRPRETRKCHHCGKVGHLIRNCWDLRDKRKKKKDKEDEDSNNDSNAVIDDSDGDL
ncbi:hypothetical protein G4B88_019683 [Cannabis sativa]|uniref:CCHC-type domain-containing protein n=1 Tax=Cannabis sativa TaxID=3483 RepID=A0A7J6HRR0_CANSA|nr:hypothetical protein G4B88_019683 [Cannabis sativa]